MFIFLTFDLDDTAWEKEVSREPRKNFGNVQRFFLVSNKRKTKVNIPDCDIFVHWIIFFSEFVTVKIIFEKVKKLFFHKILKSYGKP